MIDLMNGLRSPSSKIKNSGNDPVKPVGRRCPVVFASGLARSRFYSKKNAARARTSCAGDASMLV